MMFTNRPSPESRTRALPVRQARRLSTLLLLAAALVALAVFFGHDTPPPAQRWPQTSDTPTNVGSDSWGQ